MRPELGKEALAPMELMPARMKRFRTREGGIVEHGRVVGKGGSLVEHVILSTELEPEPPHRETVLRR